MCATLVGGMTRLKRDYIEAAKSCGVSLKVFDGNQNRIAARIGRSDLLIVFTDKLNHSSRREAVEYARANNIPFRLLHSSGISTLKACLRETRAC